MSFELDRTGEQDFFYSDVQTNLQDVPRVTIFGDSEQTHQGSLREEDAVLITAPDDRVDARDAGQEQHVVGVDEDTADHAPASIDTPPVDPPSDLLGSFSEEPDEYRARAEDLIRQHPLPGELAEDYMARVDRATVLLHDSAEASKVLLANNFEVPSGSELDDLMDQPQETPLLTFTSRELVVAAIHEGLVVPEETKGNHERGGEYQHLVRTASEAIDQMPERDLQQEVLGLARGEQLRGHALYPVDKFGWFPSAPGPMSYPTHYDHRTALIQTHTNSPDTAEAIVENQVVALHASGSASLLPVLQDGLKPLDQLRAEGDPVHVGGRDAVGGDVREVTSFLPFVTGAFAEIALYAGGPLEPSRLLSTATRYLAAAEGMRPEVTNEIGEQTIALLESKAAELEATAAFITKEPVDAQEAELQALVKENYPVIWGLSIRNVGAEQILRIQGVEGEFGVRNLTREDTPVVFVPEAKVSEVESFARRQNSRVVVLPVEHLPQLAGHLGSRQADTIAQEMGSTGKGLWDRLRDLIRRNPA